MGHAVGAATTVDGNGYWLAGADGGVVTAGDTGFFGSAGGLHLAAPVVGMAPTPDGRGYWLAGADGGVMTFGDAGFFGSAGGLHLAAPVVGMAPVAAYGGYLLVSPSGAVAAGLPAPPDPGATPPGAAASPPASAGDGDPSPASPAVAPSPTGGGIGYGLLYPDGRGHSAARWNPCAPIRYAVNLGDAPSSVMSDLAQALDAVTAATGVRFQYVGQTTFLPEAGDAAHQDYPAGTDAVIAWATGSQVAQFATGQKRGWGGDQWSTNASGQEVVTNGYVLINGSLLSDGTLTEGFASGDGEGHLLLHELGHVMGLGHVADPTQVMDPVQTTASATAYGAGDLAGLRAVTAGGCLSPP
ncbi:MAG TPA: hypothetical protein VFH45_08400 [Acidimicrobiales bacterium]|nr:hypothetical protein [Acidimicrobiales bacterium]